MTVDLAPDGVVVVSGEVDMATAPRLEAALETAVAGAGDVVVDLAAVSFMDSSGLNVIVRCCRPLDAADRQLILRSPQPSVRRLFEIGGMSTLVRIEG